MACKKRIFLILIFVLINASLMLDPAVDVRDSHADFFNIRKESHAKGEGKTTECPLGFFYSHARAHDRIVSKSAFTCTCLSEQPSSSWDLNSEVLRLSRKAQSLLEDPLFESGLILYACSTLLTMLLTHYDILKHPLYMVTAEQMKRSRPRVSPWNQWLEDQHFQVFFCSCLLIYCILMIHHTRPHLIYFLSVIFPTVLNRIIKLVNRLRYCLSNIRPQTRAKMMKYLRVFLKIPSVSIIDTDKTNLLTKQDIAAETRKLREKAKIRRKKRKTVLDDLLDFPFWKTNKARLEFVYALFRVDYSEVLHRVASYHGPFHERCIATERLSVMQMAQNGFYYPGSGNGVRCAGCGYTVVLEDIRSDLSEPQYHNSATCSFVHGNVEAPRRPCTGQPGDAESEQNALAQAPSQPSGLLENEEASGNDCQSPHTVMAAEAARGRPTYIHKDGNLFSSQDGDSTQLSPQPSLRFGQAESMPPSSTAAPTEAKAAQAENGTLQQAVITQESAQSQALPSTAAATTSSQVHSSASDSDGAAAAAAPATGQSERSILLATGSASRGYSMDSIQTNDVSKGWTDAKVIETEFETSSSKPNRIAHFKKIECEKNKGHHTFLMTDIFKESDMPSETDHPSLYHLIKHMSQLTVRVVVGVTSKARPKGDPCLKKENRKGHRFGTGFVCMDDGRIDKPNQPSASSGSYTARLLMKTLLRKHEKGQHVYIVTTRHTVFDNLEASNCYVDFFYDTADRKDVITVKGVSVIHGSFEGDYSSVLICKVSDAWLLEMINKTKESVLSDLESIPKEWMQRLFKHTFIISHPHGAEKVLSYGESAVIKYVLDDPEVEGGSRRLVQLKNSQPGLTKHDQAGSCFYTCFSLNDVKVSTVAACH